MPIEIFGESSFETAWSGNSEHQEAFLEKMVSNRTFPLAVPSMENCYNTLFNDPISTLYLMITCYENK